MVQLGFDLLLFQSKVSTHNIRSWWSEATISATLAFKRFFNVSHIQGDLFIIMENSYLCCITMRTNLPKLLDFWFCILSLHFSLEFFIMIFFVANQLNVSKFLLFERCKTLNFLLIETKFHQFSKFLLIVYVLNQKGRRRWLFWPS